MKIKTLFILLTSISIAGCWSFDKKEVSKIDDSKTITFIQNSNANSSWDTTFTYVFELQEQFENTNTLMCFEGDIADIIKDDSTYVLKLNHKTANEFGRSDFIIAYARITPQLKSEILSKIESNSLSTGAFNLKVSKIRPSTIGISPEIEGNGDHAFPYLEYNYSSSLLIIDAELINYQLDEAKFGFED
jgi:hypothetical protein